MRGICARNDSKAIVKISTYMQEGFAIVYNQIDLLGIVRFPNNATQYVSDRRDAAAMKLAFTTM